MRRFFDGAHRWELPACLAVTLIPPAIALPFSPPAALGLLIGLLIGNGLHLWGLSRRRRQMRQLSQELSGLLRGETSLSLEDYREGELAILRDELQKLLTQLQHSNTALRKDRMLLADSLADISHQLRTPLTSMELMVSLLRSPEVPEQKRRQLLRDLEKLLQRTEWLIEALLKLSRLDAGTVSLRLQDYPLRELVRRAAEPLQVAMELREQSLSTDLPETYLRCDPLWTGEALSNLLKNAMEHTPPGGRIALSGLVTPIYTQITLEDTGSGFSPEDLPHLFERFYRGKNADPGSFGIGLALTRRILSEQDCTIQAANRPEGGARFILRFYHSTV